MKHLDIPSTVKMSKKIFDFLNTLENAPEVRKFVLTGDVFGVNGFRMIYEKITQNRHYLNRLQIFNT